MPDRYRKREAKKEEDVVGCTTRTQETTSGEKNEPPSHTQKKRHPLVEEEENAKENNLWVRKVDRIEMPVEDRLRFIHYLASYPEYFDILDGKGKSFLFFF